MAEQVAPPPSRVCLLCSCLPIYLCAMSDLGLKSELYYVAHQVRDALSLRTRCPTIPSMPDPFPVCLCACAACGGSLEACHLVVRRGLLLLDRQEVRRCTTVSI